MNSSRIRVAAIYAISAWPLFNFLAVNWAEVLSRGFGSILIILLLTVLIGVVGHVLFRNGDKFGYGGLVKIGWLALIALFFSYTHVRAFFNVLIETASLRDPGTIACLLLGLLVLGLVYRYRNVVKLQNVATTFCLIVGGASLLTLVVTVFTTRPVPAANAPSAMVAAASARAASPDIYYIILDAYAGKFGMSKLGFDNSAFLDSMKSRGFADVSTDMSNYMRTVNTLTSIFALDYAKTEDSGTWGIRVYPQIFDDTNAPALVGRMKAAGYRVWRSPTIWGSCTNRNLECLGETHVTEPDYMLQAFLAATPLGRPIAFAVFKEYKTFPLVISSVPLLRSTPQPDFVFVHYISPHPPYFLDRECRKRDVRSEDWADWNGWDPKDRGAYIGAVECVNSQTERLVDKIIQSDPGALIVLQADHGSGFAVPWDKPMSSWTATQITERASYLNLVRAPAECAKWLDHPLGQINTARFVVGCAEGRAPTYLPEHTYLAAYSIEVDGNQVRLFK